MSVELPTNEPMMVDSQKLNLWYLSFHPPNFILTSDEHEGEGEGSEKNENVDAADGDHEDNDDDMDDAQSERLKFWELNCLGHIYRKVNCQLP